MKPIKITKYVNNGLIPLIDESAALNTAVANSGVNVFCMNIGTIIGDNIAHFVLATGTKTEDINIIIKHTIMSMIPESSMLFRNSANDATINIPIFVCLKIKQNCAAKKMSTNSDEKPFK